MSFTTPTTQDTRTRFSDPEVLSMMKYWPDLVKKSRQKQKLQHCVPSAAP